MIILFSATGFAHAGGLVAAWGDNSAGQTQVSPGVNNVKAVAAGFQHSLALKGDGTVVAWGNNASGQATIPPGLANVTAIAAGSAHNLALLGDNTVIAWGDNSSGQTNVPSGLSNVVAIAAGGPGGLHNLALKADGTVVEWGKYLFTTASAPAGLSNVIAIAASQRYDLALESDGSVVAWGEGDSCLTLTNLSSGLSNVTALAAGASHGYALAANGIVTAWGTNCNGDITSPPTLSGIKTIAEGLALKFDGTVVTWGYNGFGQTNIPTGLGNVTAIAAGGNHNLAIVSDGPIQIIQAPTSQNVPWSSNVTLSVIATGQQPLSYQWLRNGSPLNDNAHLTGSTTANLTFSGIQFGDTGTYTLRVTNAFGSVMTTGAVITVIGPPTITLQPLSQSVQASSNVTLIATAEGTPVLGYQWLFNGAPLAGAAASSLSLANVQPSTTGIYSLLVTNAYGSAQSADALLTVTDTPPVITSQKIFAQVAPLGGTATFSVTAHSFFPLTYQWRFNGVDIPGATNPTLTLSSLRYDQGGFYNVAISNAFGVTVSVKALLSVVQAFVWSDSSSEIPTNTPPGVTNLIAVAAGYNHVLALGSDQKVTTWVRTGISQSTVTNIPASVSNVIAIAAGGNVSMALRSNGTVVAWGLNTFLQTNVPPGLSNVVAISVGENHALALKTDGTVIAWGSNSLGQTNIPPGLSNVVAIAGGGFHSLALKSDGTVVAWGLNRSAQTNVPPGLSNVIAIAAGDAHSLALKSDGTVAAWGSPTVPVSFVPQGLSNVVAIAAGYSMSIALKSDGTVVTWGNKQNSQSAQLTHVFAVAGGGLQASFGVAPIGSGAPVFTVQPFSQTTTRGATVQFNVRAAGVQPLKYQWQLEGTNLPGATNVTLAVTNVLGKNIGGYRAVITNSLGAVTSSTAFLTAPISLADALSTTGLIWTNGAATNAPWFGEIDETHDGDAAAESGPIGNNQQSVLQTTVVGPGTLTFWWKVSSEQGFDFLRFLMDTSSVPLASISGEFGWQQKTFSISTGTHILKWVYAKDASVSDGEDAGWVDQVVFTPAPPVITEQPLSLTTSMGASVTLEAAATGAPNLNYQWLRTGTNLPGATQATLTLPCVTRRDSGVYTLMVSNDGGTVMSSNATLVVHTPQRLGAPTRQADGSMLLICGDADGGSLLASDVTGFVAQASTNLVDWVTLNGALTLTNGMLQLVDTDSSNWSMRFYRVVEYPAQQ